MNLATHNSMSYLEPLRWWMRLLLPLARCQTKNLRQQWEEGVRLFDLRVRWNESRCRWDFAHGPVTFEGMDIYGACTRLCIWSEDAGEKAHVRLILEYNRKPSESYIPSLFADLAFHLSELYPELHFFEFRQKWNWHQVVLDKEPPAFRQCVGSMSGKWYGKLWPWLYARRHNEAILNEAAIRSASYPDEFTMIDFI